MNVREVSARFLCVNLRFVEAHCCAILSLNAGRNVCLEIEDRRNRVGSPASRSPNYGDCARFRRFRR